MFITSLQEASDYEMTTVSVAVEDMNTSYMNYYRRKGWFTCDSVCMTEYNKYIPAKSKVDGMRMHMDGMTRQGRHAVGIWSKFGVTESKTAFKNTVNDGWETTKRMTLFDVVLGVATRSSDDSYSYEIIKYVFKFISNFFISMVIAVFHFCIKVLMLVREYGASIPSATLFITLSFIGATSIIISIFIVILGPIFGYLFYATVRASLQDKDTTHTNTTTTTPTQRIQDHREYKKHN
eukprot:GHVR01091116.1.p1 GENE.GHVR01091116.1~~GHVR01091116.1.p1  ORF type:complete len:236 (-),score=42.79 GHVR01091116.1:75-782(-)